MATAPAGISADGRFVVFVSDADTWLHTNSRSDIFLKNVTEILKSR
jgi:hypothetical protein